MGQLFTGTQAEAKVSQAYVAEGPQGMGENSFTDYRDAITGNWEKSIVACAPSRRLEGSGSANDCGIIFPAAAPNRFAGTNIKHENHREDTQVGKEKHDDSK